MERKSVWSRIETWFHPGSGGGVHADLGGEATLNTSLATLDRDRATGAPAGKSTRRPAPVLPTRERQYQQLQEGFQRLTSLVDSLQTHMSRQEQRTEQVAESLADLAKSLAMLPASTREQSATLSHIADQMAAANKQTERLAEVMAEIPENARVTNTILTGLERRLESAGKIENDLGTSLRTFAQAVTAQTALMKQLSESNEKRDESWTLLVREQGKRFTVLFAVTVTLAAFSLGTTVLMVVLQMKP